MRAKSNRDMCATCRYWNGPREVFENYVSFEIDSKGMCLNKKSKFYVSHTSVLKSYCFDWVSLKKIEDFI